jgi:hypothetical protein
MGRTAGKVEAAHVGAAIVWLESTEKASMAGKAVDRAVKHMVAAVDIVRSQRMLNYDPRFDIFQSGGTFEFFQNDSSIVGQHAWPVMVWPQIRRVHQHVQSFPAARGDIGVCARRRTEITGWIGRRLALAIDGIEFLVGIAREDEVVM